MEMADPFHVLVIVSIGDRHEDLEQLVDALEIIAKRNSTKAGSTWDAALPHFRSVPGMTPREAFFANHEYMDIDESKGRLSSEIVTVYPPGIPLLVPGEVITAEVLTLLIKVSELGGTVDGLAEDGKIGVVKISQA